MGAQSPEDDPPLPRRCSRWLAGSSSLLDPRSRPASPRGASSQRSSAGTSRRTERPGHRVPLTLSRTYGHLRLRCPRGSAPVEQRLGVSLKTGDRDGTGSAAMSAPPCANTTAPLQFALRSAAPPFAFEQGTRRERTVADESLPARLRLEAAAEILSRFPRTTSAPPEDLVAPHGQRPQCGVNGWSMARGLMRCSASASTATWRHSPRASRASTRSTTRRLTEFCRLYRLPFLGGRAVRGVNPVTGMLEHDWNDTTRGRSTVLPRARRVLRGKRSTAHTRRLRRSTYAGTAP